MLRLTRIEDGACYVTDSTNLYVAWSMLCSSSKLFWGCGIIRNLDRVRSLLDQSFGDNPEAFSELTNLLQSNESSVLDAVRIVICFENYFKAKMLLNGYIIHQLDLNECKKLHPEFIKKNAKKVPILLDDIKKAEKHDVWSAKPLQTLTERTIEFNVLVNEAKYKNIYSKNTPEDIELFSLLKDINKTRNTLHFLSIEYIGGDVNGFVFLRDYVSNHIDALANKIIDENKWELDVGKREIDHLMDPEDMEYEDIEGENE